MPYDYERVSEDVLEKLRYAKSELDILSKGIYDPETQRKLDESMKLVNEFWGGYDKWDSLRVKEQEEQEQTELEKVIEQLVLADQENQRLRQAMSAQPSQSLETPITNHLNLDYTSPIDHQFAEEESESNEDTEGIVRPKRKPWQIPEKIIDWVEEESQAERDRRKSYVDPLQAAREMDKLEKSKYQNTPENRKRVSQGAKVVKIPTSRDTFVYRVLGDEKDTSIFKLAAPTFSRDTATKKSNPFQISLDVELLRSSQHANTPENRKRISQGGKLVKIYTSKHTYYWKVI